MMTREIRETGSRLLLRLFATFAYFAGLFSAVAEEPFFKKGDVIALVGGEDMVAMSEYGLLEFNLTRALPDHRLKFRNLAWEGDTVFEQRRDLNFPTWEQALDQIGATVVICQFGQMESLAGKEKLPEFIAAYEKLIGRFSNQAKRRVVLLPPNQFWNKRGVISDAPQRNEVLMSYKTAERELANRLKVKTVGGFDEQYSNDKNPVGEKNEDDPFGWPDSLSDDGVHESIVRGMFTWDFYAAGLGGINPWEEAAKDNLDELGNPLEDSDKRLFAKIERQAPLHEAIIAKNRLWFDYWRVQNWAFLAGDRTEQPSSRDHVDRTKRWFPAEREQFLPLIEKKEQEIWSLAAKLSEQK